MADETTQQFLARRKKELLAQISALKGQLAPKEAELAQITRFEASETIAESAAPNAVMGTIYGTANPLLAYNNSAAGISSLFGPEKTNEFAQSSEALSSAISRAMTGSSAISDAFSRVIGVSPTSLRYAHMTIKQMVIQALLDHFPKGATAAEIRDYIRDGYGRPVDPSSLRPQMHRLKANGVLLHDAKGDVWNLPKAVRANPVLQQAGLEISDD